MKSFIVYKHTCPNNKCYIGITSYKNPNQRWRNGESYLGDKKHLTKWGAAIIKYGWENIKHEIENLKYLLDASEIESINLYEIYISINDLITKKRIIKDKIISYQLENNISLTDELFSA